MGKIQEQARQVAEELGAGLADPDSSKDPARFFPEQVDVMADDLMDRALQGSYVHAAGLDRTALAKPGQVAAIGSRVSPGLHSGVTTLRRPGLVFAKPGKFPSLMSPEPVLPQPHPSVRVMGRYSRSSTRRYAAEGGLPDGGMQNSSVATASGPSESEAVEEGGFDLAKWFDPNTRGGAIVWGFLLLVVPVAAYQILLSTGMEETRVGPYVGAIFVLVSNLLWGSTYIFRVANKDMTYAKQLRNYEEAVMAKRLEEIPEADLEAIMAEIEQEKQQNR